jgi:hypothetical protein
MMMDGTTTSICDASQQRAIHSFRLILAAAGYRAYLLNDDDVWRWLQNLIQQLSTPRLTHQEMEGAAKTLDWLYEGA